MAGVPIAERGPGWSYRPDERPPSVFGEHQPGIDTPRLDHLALAAFDLPEGTAPGEVLAAWTAEAEAAMRAAAGAVTVTLGLGPGLFTGGLRGQRPVALRDLPPFAGDALAPAWCGGDLLLQVCARSSQDAAAALSGFAGARPRWRQDGWLRRDPRDPAGGTPRDPLGFRDGSGTIRRGRDRDRHVWAGRGDRTWMAGGTYLVVRRIEVLEEAWAQLPVAEQERVIGRHKTSGAPLGGRREFDPIVWSALPPDSHARLAAPVSNGGTMMLRRGYSYDGGVVFLAYVRDPARQYAPVQRRLAERDALSPFVRHVGSAVFAIPPGARPGGVLAGDLVGR